MYEVASTFLLAIVALHLNEVLKYVTCREVVSADRIFYLARSNFVTVMSFLSQVVSLIIIKAFNYIFNT
jgi:hypothetical protein